MSIRTQFGVAPMPLPNFPKPLPVPPPSHESTESDSESPNSSQGTTGPNSLEATETTEEPLPSDNSRRPLPVKITAGGRGSSTPVWRSAARTSDSAGSILKAPGFNSSSGQEASVDAAAGTSLKGSSAVQPASGGSAPTAPLWKRVAKVGAANSPLIQGKVSAHRQRSADVKAPDLLRKKTEEKENSQPKVYELSDDIPPEEEAKIKAMLDLHPEFTKRYDIRIRKVTHPVLERQFDSKKEGLNLADNEALLGSWRGKPEQEIRQSVAESIDAAKSKAVFSNSAGEEVPSNVYTMMVCHATKMAVLEAVLKSGLHGLARTDQGYFGQGIYFTTHPEYSVLYGGRGGGCILICEVAFRTLFPVAPSDDLMGKPILPGFDGHAVHVVPKTNNPKEMMYVSRGLRQKAKYDEIVVRDPSQTVIRYVMEYKPKESFASQMSETATRTELRKLILAYMKENPSSDQVIPLNLKLNEINGLSEETLGANEVELLHFLQRSLGERDVNTQKNLGERIQKLLITDDSPEVLASQHPDSFIDDMETKEKQDANLKKADQLLSKDKFRQAFEEYKKVLTSIPESFRARVGCGMACYQEKKWDEAIFYFDQALRSKPRDNNACANIVSALVERAKECITQPNDKAERDLLRALNYDSNNIKVLGMIASIYFSKDRFDEAFSMASRAIAMRPEHAPCLRLRGACYAALGKEHCEKAEKDLSASLRAQSHPFAFIHRAHLYIAMNRLEDALKDCNTLLDGCDKKLKDDPGKIEGLKIRAKISLLQKNLKQAEKDLKECKKDDPAVLALWGELYLQKNNLKEALKHLTESIEIYNKWKAQKLLREKDLSDFYDALLLRAEVHHQMDSVTSAVDDYQQAMALFPEKSRAYQLRGDFYKKRKDEAKAQADYKKVGELERFNSSGKDP